MTTFKNKRSSSPSTIEIAESLYIINKKAKHSSNKQYYILKQTVIERLILEKKAKKIGLHRSPLPRNKYKTETLVQIETYYFHLPPTNEDLDHLPILGARKGLVNPKIDKSVRMAKNTLVRYLNNQTYLTQQTVIIHPTKLDRSIFISSYLNG